ncbi:MAG: AAA family ATPase [Candidatus Methanoperedens sp.]|nr:AAA family ATPase [Candidatus Methanoperedens sp.]
MTITKIRLSNFKSFKNLEVGLNKFNVLIGANASGKSSFIQIFKFLRDMTNHGLDNAISMQGGIQYLRNINIGQAEEFSLEVTSDKKYTRFSTKTNEKEMIGIKTYKTIYKIVIKLKDEGKGFEFVEEKISQKCDFVKLEKKKNPDEKKKYDEKEKLGEGEITVTSLNGKINVNLNLPIGVKIKEENLFPPFFKEEVLKDDKFESKSLLLQYSFFIMPPIFSDFSIYDFDPKLPKKATPITGKAELEEDGSNLAIALKNILENEDTKRKFSNLVRDVLPFVEDLDIEKFSDKSLLFKLREIYSENQYLPAPFLSDGTICITALIIALYFDRKPLIIIEEPERNIHPYLISRLINMMKEVSEGKQIIVTNHNPDVIKHAGLENILFVSRNKEGFSTISKLSEKEEVKIFLENEMGIEDLYVQNLLEI